MSTGTAPSSEYFVNDVLVGVWVRACVRTCVLRYVSVFVFGLKYQCSLHVHSCLFMCVCVCVCVHACVCVSMCVWGYVCVSVCLVVGIYYCLVSLF